MQTVPRPAQFGKFGQSDDKEKGPVVTLGLRALADGSQFLIVAPVTNSAKL